MRHRHRMTVALGLAAGLFVAGCAGATSGSITTTMPGGLSEQIPAAVSKPDGSGPFPAVVTMHDCSGLGPSSSGAPDRWRGYAGGVCTVTFAPGRTDVSPERRVRDAYAALAHLRTLAYVDGRRVGLMGGSHGGTTTLTSMIAPQSDGELLARERRAGFAAAVALYPRCTRSGRADAAGVYRPVAPLLILIGESDDWTPAEPCRKLTEAARAAGHPLAIKVYPGAHHSFDSYNPIRYVETRVNPNSPTGRGATTGGDPRAWADSIREVTAFFGQHLRS